MALGGNKYSMTPTQRNPLASFLAPGFLLLLSLIFLVAPWSLKDKLDGVCFGI